VRLDLPISKTILAAWTQANAGFAMSAVAGTELLCGPLDSTAVSLATVIVDRRINHRAELAGLAAQPFSGTGRSTARHSGATPWLTA